MPIYKREIIADEYDMDYNGVARASSIMRYIQSTAQLQLTDIGMTYTAMKNMNKAFILSKIKMEFLEPIRTDDVLTVETFPADSRAYSFVRCYGIKRAGHEIFRAISSWALIDTENRSLIKVKDYDLGLTTQPQIDMELDRIILPTELSEIGKYRVNYGDIDRNMHMNNAKYPDMYSAFLPLENKRIKSMYISYMNEAKAFDTLTVFSGENDGTYSFKTLRSDGLVNTVAQLTLTDIQ